MGTNPTVFNKKTISMITIIFNKTNRGKKEAVPERHLPL